ncbi:actin-domain-containing protein [Lineolata rhizophorae]|uniref:Actin-domain-containing protein n=1 Tax=Lineolata rhizophorae TaxID=578093 RepID=A0A6A6P4I2_9PEZI|nr:actin-domain-containing protein [Lineolata rhizophorae]
MATVSDPSSRKVSVGRIRPTGGSHNLASITPSSPHTPIRSVGSLYGSPSSAFQSDQEPIVLECGTRFLRAGFAGEHAPRCILDYGPEQQRRVGDYRSLQPGYRRSSRTTKDVSSWGRDYELWRSDLRSVDLQLVEDRLDRAMREAHLKYMLHDSKPRRVILTLPSLIPHALLSSVLAAVFNTFQTPNITLVPTHVSSAIGAGVRSALVVDIGWAETTVTAVYEYREIHTRRSVRAGKTLSFEMARTLNETLQDAGIKSPNNRVGFEEAEEVLLRMGWCRPSPFAAAPNRTTDNTASLSFPSIFSEPVDIPFSRLADPAETALFASNTSGYDLDEHDQPLHLLVYAALLAVPFDVRRACMSRILITGGVANLPGVKTRIFRELEHIIESRGWDPIRNYGKAGPSSRRPKVAQRGSTRTLTPAEDRKESPRKVSDSVSDPSTPSSTTTASYASAPSPTNPAHQDTPLDKILAKHTEAATRGLPTPPPAIIRGIVTLGPWAGASLFAASRLRAVVEIDRDRFFSQGLGGAKEEREVDFKPSRMSLGPSLGRGLEGRNAWTLAGWG